MEQDIPPGYEMRGSPPRLRRIISPEELALKEENRLREARRRYGKPGYDQDLHASMKTGLDSVDFKLRNLTIENKILKAENEKLKEEIIYLKSRE